MIANLSRATAGAAALLLSACATPELYYWGDYEDSVSRVSSETEGFDVVAETDLLETTLEKAQNNDKAVPPGFHAHLAYLLYMRGDVEGAVRQLETEKSRYPDSAKLVDFLLNRMSTSKAP